jgi:uncharacterized Zn finger protein (UPF0148 family)
LAHVHCGCGTPWSIAENGAVICANCQRPAHPSIAVLVANKS